MKEKKIFDGITDVSDELIEEARKTRLKKKNKKWKKWLALAASLVLILSMGFLLSKGDKGSSYTGPILDVIYPKAYAFEDLHAKIDIMEENPLDQGFIDSINQFSYKTGAMVLNEEGKNVNYSPLSLYYALAIVASGAEGETEAELLDLLGVSDSQFLAEQSGNLYRRLYRDNEIGKLHIANSIWLDDNMNGEKIEFKEEFIEQVVEDFYASSYSVDFSNQETGIAMAKWISDNTRGTLSPTIETNPEQILSIINTVYFYDQWINRFDKDNTAEDVFYLLNGNKVKTDFMNQTFQSHFTKGNGFAQAKLQLKNEGEMVFILPDHGVSPYDLLSTPEKMEEIFGDGDDNYIEVVWKIPKFNFGSEFEMVDMLKNLGINGAFNPNADFTGITNHMAFISKIRQETHIAIDEIGVEASAFIQIDYIGAGLPEERGEMILDRPFIYGIRADNGSLLFMGVCENPAE